MAATESLPIIFVVVKSDIRGQSFLPNSVWINLGSRQYHLALRLEAQKTQQTTQEQEERERKRREERCKVQSAK